MIFKFEMKSGLIINDCTKNGGSKERDSHIGSPAVKYGDSKEYWFRGKRHHTNDNYGSTGSKILN